MVLPEPRSPRRADHPARLALQGQPGWNQYGDSPKYPSGGYGGGYGQGGYGQQGGYTQNPYGQNGSQNNGSYDWKT